MPNKAKPFSWIIKLEYIKASKRCFIDVLLVGNIPKELNELFS